MQKDTPFENRLVFWGAVLFMLGLLQGVIVGAFTNPRMALAAVLSGMALRSLD